MVLPSSLRVTGERQKVVAPGGAESGRLCSSSSLCPRASYYLSSLKQLELIYRLGFRVPISDSDRSLRTSIQRTCCPMYIVLRLNALERNSWFADSFILYLYAGTRYRPHQHSYPQTSFAYINVCCAPSNPYNTTRNYVFHVYSFPHPYIVYTLASISYLLINYSLHNLIHSSHPTPCLSDVSGYLSPYFNHNIFLALGLSVVTISQIQITYTNHCVFLLQLKHPHNSLHCLTTFSSNSLSRC